MIQITRRSKLARILRAGADTASETTTDAIARWRLRKESVPHFSVAGVYRQRNARRVAKLVRGLDDVRLWALDDIDPELAEVTLGCGAGSRMSLLNRLSQNIERPYIVLLDDDIEFVIGDVRRVVITAHRHRLDFCQPAQTHRGYASHEITTQRRFSALRITNFVEIGPLLVIGPRLRKKVVPFPEDAGFGWGLDVEWSALAQTDAARFGIVDAAIIRHLNPAGVAYNRGPERERLEAALSTLGADSIAAFASTRQIVRPWRL